MLLLAPASAAAAAAGSARAAPGAAALRGRGGEVRGLSDLAAGLLACSRRFATVGCLCTLFSGQAGSGRRGCACGARVLCMQRALAGASHSPRREERCELHQQRAAPLEVAAVAGLVAAAAGGRGGAPSAEHRPGAALDALRHGSVAPQRSSPWPRLQGCSLANHLSLCLLNKASQGLRSDLFRPLRRASRQCVMPEGGQE